MSSGSPESWRDWWTVAKHSIYLMNHERHNRVLDYDGLASEMEDCQDIELCVWISLTYITPRLGDMICGSAPRWQEFLSSMRHGKCVSGAIGRHARGQSWQAQPDPIAFNAIGLNPIQIDQSAWQLMALIWITHRQCYSQEVIRPHPCTRIFPHIPALRL